MSDGKKSETGSHLRCTMTSGKQTPPLIDRSKS